MALLLDVTDETAIGRAIETVAAQTQGQRHGLVNNAGVGLGGLLERWLQAQSRRVGSRHLGEAK